MKGTGRQILGKCNIVVVMTYKKGIATVKNAISGLRRLCRSFAKPSISSLLMALLPFVVVEAEAILVREGERRGRSKTKQHKNETTTNDGDGNKEQIEKVTQRGGKDLPPTF
jgi:hypothetical protein